MSLSCSCHFPVRTVLCEEKPPGRPAARVGSKCFPTRHPSYSGMQQKQLTLTVDFESQNIEEYSRTETLNGILIL